MDKNMEMKICVKKKKKKKKQSRKKYIRNKEREKKKTRKTYVKMPLFAPGIFGLLKEISTPPSLTPPPTPPPVGFLTTSLGKDSK